MVLCFFIVIIYIEITFLYVEVGNPVRVKFSNTVPITHVFGMKSLFSDNSWVVYKQGSLASGGVGTVKNSRHKGKHT